MTAFSLARKTLPQALQGRVAASLRTPEDTCARATENTETEKSVGDGRERFTQDKVSGIRKSMNFKMHNTGKVHSIPLSLGNTELLEALLTRCSYRREASYSMTKTKNYSP